MSSPQDKPDKTQRMRPRRSQLTVLSPSDIERINDAALHLLEQVGFSDVTPSGAEAMTKAGAIVGADGRIRFPRRMVLASIDKAARGFTLFGQDSNHDLPLGTARVHYGTAGAAVQFVEAETGLYREARLQDLYDAARLAESLPHIHFFQRPMVARDIADPLAMDINTLYACLSGTTKHVGTSFAVREHVAPALDMMHMVAGGEAKFRARPFVSNSNAFVISPMQFAEQACGVLEACVAGGLPILLLATGQAGSTAPQSLAGAVAQTVAEVLAGLVYVNALKPGHPAIFGAWPFASDPRSGKMASGSAEQSLLAAACAEMAGFYDLPCGSGAGMTEARLPDIQSGYEKGMTEVMAGFAGLDLVYEAAGMHASLIGFCHESLILDNDLIGQCLRCLEGIEVTGETLSLDEIAAVCVDGPRHYLASDPVAPDQRYRPALADRSGSQQRETSGGPSIVERATVEKNRLLTTFFPRHIPKTMDERIRARFGDLIQLPRAAMGL